MSTSPIASSSNWAAALTEPAYVPSNSYDTYADAPIPAYVIPSDPNDLWNPAPSAPSPEEFALPPPMAVDGLASPFTLAPYRFASPPAPLMDRISPLPAELPLYQRLSHPPPSHARRMSIRNRKRTEEKAYHAAHKIERQAAKKSTRSTRRKPRKSPTPTP
jgi:hypothetical protein